MARVFISYSHDSDAHKTRVRDLAKRLGADDVTVIIDQDKLPGGPAEGWPDWSEAQVKDADFVLIACTERYRGRYESTEAPGEGLGAVWEAGIIKQLLYEKGGINEKFRVVLFSTEDERHVPTQLAKYHRFLLNQQAAYEQLVAWIRGSGLGPAPGKSPPGTIAWPAPAPAYVWPLADRKPEFSFFEAMITGQAPKRILLVHGASNTGKTVFFAELITYARHLGVPSSLIDLKGCPSLDDLFQTLVLDLGPEILRHAHAASGTGRFFQLIADLQQSTAPILLMFDTYEQASEDTRKWLESQLLPRLDRAPGVVVLIGGQQVPEHGKHSWRSLTERRELKPIQRVDDWLDYSRRKWPGSQIKPDHVEGFTLATDGNPGQVYALLESIAKRRTEPKV